MREIARARGLSHAGVHNAFKNPRVPSRDVMEAIAGYLTMRVKDWDQDADHDDPIGKELQRLDTLWRRAREEADRGTAPGALQHTPGYTRDLLRGLSPACSVCDKTQELDRLHDIVALKDPSPKKFSPTALRRLIRYRRQKASNPWLLLRLCLSCRRRQDAGEFSDQELREARLALDRRPGAARHYAAYLDQIFLGGERILDMNVASSALAIVKADPETATSPYVLAYGKIRVDRTGGSLSWGQYSCEDEHPA
ncbi:hypothetical protein ACIQNK_39625 [Streptomyces sp. NPDC091273]|uniref:hypothetical protein n=1 Tax=Streptomyces sp. NPDC091273 TaxID=3365982 RepID=UPI00380B05C9